jgi:hypothetical protein
MAEWTHWHSKGADALLAACEKAEKERDEARQVARTLFGQLWEEWRFNSVREELEVMEKELPWLKEEA